MSSIVQDSTYRYGLISRGLHWGMALLLGWQFFTTTVRVLMEDSALDEFTWGTHKAAGTLLMTLILLRVIWALINYRQRPPALSMAARLGHWVLYALMLIIPLLALLRQYGSGREFAVFGLQLMSGFEGEIEALTAPGNLLHGWLGWTLLAMIIGHIGMTLYHRRNATEQDVLPRMAGKLND